MNRSLGCSTVCIVLTVVLVFLKVCDLFLLSWVCVTAPLWVPILISFFTTLVLLALLYYYTKKSDSPSDANRLA